MLASNIRLIARRLTFIILLSLTPLSITNSAFAAVPSGTPVIGTIVAGNGYLGVPDTAVEAVPAPSAFIPRILTL